MLPSTRFLLIAFKNIYQIFHPITFFKHMLITNQFVATDYCLINSATNTLTTILRKIFILRVFKA